MAHNCLAMFTLKIYQSKMNFIEGNQITSIKNEGRPYKLLSFQMFLPRLSPNFENIEQL